MKDKCKKCGLCCYPRKRIGDRIVIDTSERCPFMMTDNSCSIYAERQDTEKTKGRVCLMREQIKLNFPDCPYNRDDWENVEIKEQGDDTNESNKHKKGI